MEVIKEFLELHGVPYQNGYFLKTHDRKLQCETIELRGTPYNCPACKKYHKTRPYVFRANNKSYCTWNKDNVEPVAYGLKEIQKEEEKKEEKCEEEEEKATSKTRQYLAELEFFNNIINSPRINISFNGDRQESMRWISDLPWIENLYKNINLFIRSAMGSGKTMLMKRWIETNFPGLKICYLSI